MYMYIYINVYIFMCTCIYTYVYHNIFTPTNFNVYVCGHAPLTKSHLSDAAVSNNFLGVVATTWRLRPDTPVGSLWHTLVLLSGVMPVGPRQLLLWVSVHFRPVCACARVNNPSPTRQRSKSRWLNAVCVIYVRVSRTPRPCGRGNRGTIQIKGTSKPREHPKSEGTSQHRDHPNRGNIQS